MVQLAFDAIEARGQIAWLDHTKPQLLYDLVVQVALIRTGAIEAKVGQPDTEGRLGLEKVTYLHPALEPILKRTQGIPIFQEQAMAIGMALGGYSGGEADALRRTMGNIRKKEKLMLALNDLRAAMLARSARGEIEPMTPDVADKICEDLVSFANYGFPESHAWSFAVIAFATAWLKAHHPTEILLGLLNAPPMGAYPISTLIHDARRHGVTVLPPCLASGSWECQIVNHESLDPSEARGSDEGQALLIGWKFVRGIGSTVIVRMKAETVTRPYSRITEVVRDA